MKPLFIATLLALTSCATAQTDAEINPSWSDEHKTCVAEGGLWGEGGLAIGPRCFPAFADGGNSCTASADCEGFCMAETRQCASTYKLGCMAVLVGNGDEAFICFD